MIKGHWESMTMQKKCCQVLQLRKWSSPGSGVTLLIIVLSTLAAHMLQVVLFFALFLTLLLWVEHTEWGILVLLYGLWAQHTFNPRHLASFTCVLCLSICTDSLTLGGAPLSPFVAILMWAVLACKLLAFVTLVTHY